MGWMRTLLLGDIGNRLDIADAEREIALVRSSQARNAQKLQSREGQIKALQDELGRQKLAVQALTRFLVARNVISQSELDDFIKEVDAEDGVIDGKMSLNPIKKRLVFKKMEGG